MRQTLAVLAVLLARVRAEQLFQDPQQPTQLSSIFGSASQNNKQQPGQQKPQPPTQQPEQPEAKFNYKQFLPSQGHEKLDNKGFEKEYKQGHGNWQGFLPSMGTGPAVSGPANSTGPMASWPSFVPAGFGGSTPQATDAAETAADRAKAAADAKAYARDNAAAAHDETAKDADGNGKAKVAAAAQAKAAAARAKAALAAEAAAKAQAAAATKAAEAAESAAGGAPGASVVDLAGTSQVGNSLVFFVFMGSLAGTVAFLLLRAVAGARLCAVDADGPYVSLLREP